MQGQEQGWNYRGAGSDLMEESLPIAVEDCKRLGVGKDGAPHYWGRASRSLVGSETRRLDCWVTLELSSG